MAQKILIASGLLGDVRARRERAVSLSAVPTGSREGAQVVASWYKRRRLLPSIALSLRRYFYRLLFPLVALIQYCPISLVRPLHGPLFPLILIALSLSRYDPSRRSFPLSLFPPSSSSLPFALYPSCYFPLSLIRSFRLSLFPVLLNCLQTYIDLDLVRHNPPHPTTPLPTTPVKASASANARLREDESPHGML